jgi:hypothetical protein
LVVVRSAVSAAVLPLVVFWDALLLPSAVFWAVMALPSVVLLVALILLGELANL